MFTITKQGDEIRPYVTEIVVDTEEEVSSLPTHYTPGSSCIVTGTSSVYMLNNKHEWVKL